MKKKYPDDVRFLLAEDFRTEMGKKLTLLGVYAGDDINIEGESAGKDKALASIIVLIIGRGALGKFEAKVEIRNPSNELVFDPVKSTLEIVEEQNFVIPLKISPFPISELGKYTVTLSLDDRSYPYQFLIRS